MSVSGAGQNPTTTSSSSQQNQSTSSTTGSSSPASGGNSSPVNTGTQLNSGGALTIDSSPQITQGAFDLSKQLDGSALSKAGAEVQTQSAALSNQTASANQVLGQVLAADQATAANTASGGQTNNNTTLTYIVLAAIAAVVAVIVFRK